MLCCAVEGCNTKQQYRGPRLPSAPSLAARGDRQDRHLSRATLSGARSIYARIHPAIYLDLVRSDKQARAGRQAGRQAGQDKIRLGTHDGQPEDGHHHHGADACQHPADMLHVAEVAGHGGTGGLGRFWPDRVPVFILPRFLTGEVGDAQARRYCRYYEICHRYNKHNAG